MSFSVLHGKISWAVFGIFKPLWLQDDESERTRMHLFPCFITLSCSAVFVKMVWFISSMWRRWMTKCSLLNLLNKPNKTSESSREIQACWFERPFSSFLFIRASFLQYFWMFSVWIIIYCYSFRSDLFKHFEQNEYLKQRCIKSKSISTNVSNTDNQKCFLSSKSAY